MQKNSDINWNKVLRASGAGVVAGGASAAMLDLLHYIQEQRRLLAEAKERSDTDKNTLVITLPRERLAKESADLMPSMSLPSESKVKNVAQTSNKGKVQLRRSKGTFTPHITKSAVTSAPTYIASGMGLLGGAGLGYLTVDKLYSLLRKQQLRKELEEAKQEYFKNLFGTQEKVSMEKQSVNTFNKALAAYVLLSMLGTGAVGYMTKRVLDEKFKEPDVPTTLPRVKKIVFRTSPEAEDIEEPKIASDKVIAALGIELHRQKPSIGILDDIHVKEAMRGLNINKDELIDMSKSATFTERFIEGALSNDKLRNSLVGSTIQKVPMLDGLWNLVKSDPSVSNLVQDKAKEVALNKIKGNRGLRVLSSAANLLDYVPGGQWLGTQSGRLAGGIAGAFRKQGQMDPAELASSLIEKIDEGDAISPDGEDEDKYIQDLEKDIKLKQLSSPIVNSVSITGADPLAQSFVAKKKDKIKNILRTMVTTKEL